MIFRSDRGTPYGRLLASANDYYCYLSGANGEFGNSFDRPVGVYVRDGNWHLDGSPYENPRNVVFATCVSLQAFAADRGSGIWWSEAFSAYAYNDAHVTKDMWFGDAVSTLSMIGSNGTLSHLDDAKDAMWITQGGARSPSQLHVDSWRDNIFDNDVHCGSASSLFIGVPDSGYRPRFWRPEGGGGSEVTLAAYPGQSNSVDLAYMDEAFCYLNRFQGDFNGGGESIRVAPRNTGSGWKWQLIVKDGSGEGITGSARCVKWDQCMDPDAGCINPYTGQDI